MEDNILKYKFTEEELEQAIISLLEDQDYVIPLERIYIENMKMSY